jgi:hypothetical protein
MQTLWMAATTGLLLFSTTAIRLSRLGSASAFGEPNSLMSAPPEKALPAPVMTRLVTAGSASARSTPAATAARVAKPRPLTGGLSRVITAMLPRTS